MLIRQLTCGENVGEILTSLSFSAHHVANICEHTDSLRFLIDTVVRGKEEEVRLYRDDNGNSILHIACSIRNPSQLYWLKELLRIGLDPSVRNNQNKTALDVLIRGFFSHFWNLTEREDEIDSLHFIVRSFIQIVHMFLPSFKDTPIFDIKLPQLQSIRYPSVECINDACITVYSTFLNSAIFPGHTEKNLAALFSWKMYQCKKHYPCVFCKSLVELMYRALHTGLNLYRHVSKFQCGRQVTLSEHFVYHSLWCDRRIRPSKCTCHISRASGPCDCCGWQLLELMVHCRANLDHLVTIEGDGCYLCKNASLLYLLSRRNDNPPLTMSNISCVIKLIWMYQSDAKIIMKDYIHQLHDDKSDIGDRRVVNDLEDLMQAVRPLKLLCRICVLHHIQWKDIKHLAMPARLIQYLEIGDISNDHVVYKVL